MTMDQEFIEYVVKSIVSKPDDVHIDRSIDERGVLLELTVNPDDLGRVIGKRGNTAQSMRTLLRALGTKDSARYNLKIIDNGDPDYDKNKNNNDNDDNDDSDDNDNASDDSSTNDDNSSDSSSDETTSGGGAGQWAHMSSDNDETDDSSTTETEASQDEESSTSSTSQSVEQTKKELADLDDLQL